MPSRYIFWVKREIFPRKLFPFWMYLKNFTPRQRLKEATHFRISSADLLVYHIREKERNFVQHSIKLFQGNMLQEFFAESRMK